MINILSQYVKQIINIIYTINRYNIYIYIYIYYLLYI